MPPGDLKHDRLYGHGPLLAGGAARIQRLRRSRLCRDIMVLNDKCRACRLALGRRV